MDKKFEKELRPTKVLLYQSVGFIAIVAVCLLDELVGMTKLIFENQPYISDFRQTILKMLLVLVVWLLVNSSTRRALERIQYLEGFLKVCAWCRRIHYKGRWIRLEEFMKEGFDTPTSHGICKECLEQQMNALNRAKQQRRETLAQTD